LSVIGCRFPVAELQSATDNDGRKLNHGTLETGEWDLKIEDRKLITNNR